MLSARLMHVAEGVETWIVGDVPVIHQFGRYTADAIRPARPGKPPAGVGERVMLIVDPGAPPPDDAVREKLVAAMAASPMRHLAVVSTEGGFRAARVQSIVVGLRIAMRSRLEVTQHASVEEAARALGVHGTRGDDGAELAQAIGAFLAERRASRA